MAQALQALGLWMVLEVQGKGPVMGMAEALVGPCMSSQPQGSGCYHKLPPICLLVPDCTLLAAHGHPRASDQTSGIDLQLRSSTLLCHWAEG